ncbi:MAG TPA: hypothetical protein VIJ27_03085 [Mucilaginibacter sp.]
MKNGLVLAKYFAAAFLQTGCRVKTNPWDSIKNTEFDADLQGLMP